MWVHIHAKVLNETMYIDLLDISLQAKSTQTLILAVVGLITAMAVAMGKIIPAIQNILELRKAKKGKIDSIYIIGERQEKTRGFMNQVMSLEDSFDRVEIWSLSNGEKYFLNSSAHKWKATFYDDVTKGSVLSVKPHYMETTIPLTMWYDIVKGWKKDDNIIRIDDINSIKNSSTEVHFKALGVSGLISVLLKTSEGLPIGIMIISSVMSKHLTIKDNYSLYEIGQISTRISEYLHKGQE